NAYVSDSAAYTIRRISTAGAVTTVAGQVAGLGNTDGSSSVARFFNPTGVAADANGNIYVADLNNQALRSISPAGIVTTIGKSAFYNPTGIAVQSDGTVIYASDSPVSVIKKVTNGAVQIFAGAEGAHGAADGTGSSARFRYPVGVAIDQNTKAVYVAD